MKVFDMTTRNRIGRGNDKTLYNELARIQIGDILLFGSYYLPGVADPNDVKVKCPIDWQIIDKNGDRLMLLSKHSLYWNYYDGRAPIMGPPPRTSWEKSTIREELNSERIEEWFSIPEQSIIMENIQFMDENPVYQTSSGKATLDKLFLLSLEEAKRYLKIDKQSSRNLDPARGNSAGGYMIMADEDPDKEGEIMLFPAWESWWLRTSGIDDRLVICVKEDGTIDYEGIGASADEVGIRPAMWIDFGRLQPNEKDEMPDEEDAENILPFF